MGIQNFVGKVDFEEVVQEKIFTCFNTNKDISNGLTFNQIQEKGEFNEFAPCLIYEGISQLKRFGYDTNNTSFSFFKEQNSYYFEKNK